MTERIQVSVAKPEAPIVFRPLEEGVLPVVYRELYSGIWKIIYGFEGNSHLSGQVFRLGPDGWNPDYSQLWQEYPLARQAIFILENTRPGEAFDTLMFSNDLESLIAQLMETLGKPVPIKSDFGDYGFARGVVFPSLASARKFMQNEGATEYFQQLELCIATAQALRLVDALKRSKLK